MKFIWITVAALLVHNLCVNSQSPHIAGDLNENDYYQFGEENIRILVESCGGVSVATTIIRNLQRNTDAFAYTDRGLTVRNQLELRNAYQCFKTIRELDLINQSRNQKPSLAEYPGLEISGDQDPQIFTLSIELLKFPLYSMSIKNFWNGFPGSTFQSICDIITNHPTLESFTLHGGRMTSNDAAYVKQILGQNTKLRYTRINSPLEAAGIAHILFGLRTNRGLSSISLDIGIRDQNVPFLALIMKNHPTIRTWDLTSNQITDAGAKILADAMRTRPDLYLGVRYNRIQNGAIIFQGLEHVAFKNFA